MVNLASGCSLPDLLAQEDSAMASDTVASQKDGCTSTVQLLSKIPGQKTGESHSAAYRTVVFDLPWSAPRCGQHVGEALSAKWLPVWTAWWRAPSHSTEC